MQDFLELWTERESSLPQVTQQASGKAKATKSLETDPRIFHKQEPFLECKRLPLMGLSRGVPISHHIFDLKVEAAGSREKRTSLGKILRLSKSISCKVSPLPAVSDPDHELNSGKRGSPPENAGPSQPMFSPGPPSIGCSRDSVSQRWIWSRPTLLNP